MHAQFSLLNRSIVDGFQKLSSTLHALTRPTSALAYSSSQRHIPDSTGVSVAAVPSRTRRKITSSPKRRPLYAMQLAVSTAVAQDQL